MRATGRRHQFNGTAIDLGSLLHLSIQTDQKKSAPDCKPGESKPLRKERRPTGGMIGGPTDVPPIKHKLLDSLLPEAPRVRHSLKLLNSDEYHRKGPLRPNKTYIRSFNKLPRAQ